MSIPTKAARGRGAESNASGRYESQAREAFDDGWNEGDETPTPLRTTVTAEAARVIITRNDSPDVGFDRSINPYRGCEHGCIYCYARPAHAYMGLSPGLDFESKLFFKPGAAQLLEKELAKPSYAPGVIHIGGNTDPYQPQERRLRDHARGSGGAGAVPPSALDHHQVGADRSRPRYPGAHGPGGPRARRRLGHHPRPGAGAGHGAAGRDARAAAGGGPAASSKPASPPW